MDGIFNLFLIRRAYAALCDSAFNKTHSYKWWAIMFQNPDVSSEGNALFLVNNLTSFTNLNLGKLNTMVYLYVMWSRGISLKSNKTCDIFNFLLDWSAHLERYILLKTPPQSDQWFQSYNLLKDTQNNRKQQKFISFSGHISQSVLLTSDWFR